MWKTRGTERSHDDFALSNWGEETIRFPPPHSFFPFGGVRKFGTL